MRKVFPAVTLFSALLSVGAVAQDHDRDADKSQIKHVLLISIDGMHAADFKNCVARHCRSQRRQAVLPQSRRTRHDGVNYVAASTSKPSDSFPGLMTIVSGATPRTMGVYYDVAYDRSLDGPAVTTGNGNPAGPCTAGNAPTGYTTEYEEGLDIDQTKVNGGAPGAGLTDGGTASLDPSEDGPRSRQGMCAGFSVALRPH